jgi:hypothetical protein
VGKGERKTLELIYAHCRQEGDCRMWLGGNGGGGRCGHGRIRFEGKTRLVHRVVWEMVNGPIPSGGILCHRCDRPNCVNPDHLYVGTMRENALDLHRGHDRDRSFDLIRRPRATTRRWGMTHCVKGHPLSGDNLYRRPDRPNDRGCKTCRSEASRRRRARRAQVAQ